MKKLKCRMCGEVFTEREINDSINANARDFPRCKSPEAGTRPFVDSGIGGHLLREVEKPPRSCKSCGVSFSEHLGVQGTCAMLSEAVVVINLLLGAEAVVQRDEEILDNRRRREFARSFLEKLERGKA